MTQLEEIVYGRRVGGRERGERVDETKRKRFPKWGILDELRRNFFLKVTLIRLKN